MRERIGFIGLGSMGSGIAANILAKGWPLAVWAHRDRGAVEKLVAGGATEGATPRALAEQSDIVILCVTGSPEVDAVIKGPDGLASAGKNLMMSTARHPVRPRRCSLRPNWRGRGSR